MTETRPRLQVLIVDDSADDAALLVRALTRAGHDVTSRRVETAPALEEALSEGGWQVVLCDVVLPHFSGEEALRIARARGLDIPFIFASGTMGEDIAVSAMKAGADDYIVKDRLARLAPAVERELREQERRRRVEQGLQQQVRMNQALFNQAITAFALFDRGYRILQVNESYASHYGASPELLRGRDVLDLRSADHSRDQARAVIDEVVQTKAPVRFTDLPYTFHEGNDRRRSYWDTILQPILDEHGEVAFLFLSAIDVTERHRAEAALRASEQRFRQVTENIDEVFWLTDVDKREMIYVSAAYGRIWGRSCESLKADPQSWMDAIHPDDRDRVREAALTQQMVGTYDLEYRIVRPDGAIRWVHDRAFPIHDQAGRVYRIAGVAEDVTSRRGLEDQLRQAQKMEAIGRLAGGVAHDFNNLLAVIQMQSSLLLTLPSGAAETTDGLQQIMAAAERAANLTRQLLTFSRQDVRQAGDVDLGEVTDRMARLLRRVLGEDVTLETRVASALPLVNADRGMMEQVLMNLAVNARDAMPGGGRLLVALDLVEIGRDEAAARTRGLPGRFVRLRVEDTGCGMPAEDLPRIFEPFFTTKEAGRGTGLGLATVFGIVEQHQGWIDVTSEVGHGSTFEIHLPALTDATSPEASAASDLSLERGTESILLVEDDVAVRRLTRASLEHCGYRVHEAESATAALAMWDTLPQPIDLLLTDLIMPGGMSGRELADRLTRRRPGLKVIYNSGYSNEVVQRELRLLPTHSFLQKPYPVADLAAAVRHCLDRD